MKIGKYKIIIKKIEKTIFEADTSHIFSDFIEECKDNEEANRNASDVYEFNTFIKAFKYKYDSKEMYKKEVIEKSDWNSEIITMEVILKREKK